MANPVMQMLLTGTALGALHIFLFSMPELQEDWIPNLNIALEGLPWE